MVRIFIAGMDGYLGWPLALYLSARGHKVAEMDACYRRDWVAEMGSVSATPICDMQERLVAGREHLGADMEFQHRDLCDYQAVLKAFEAFRPDAIVHLGEMPSAPYSMVDIEHCVFTQTNNLTGTLNILHAMKQVCPDAHLIKLGTMGEYGTPDVDIPEGFFEIECRERRDRLPFPRQAGSWYHQTKVHDSNNIMMACRIWGLRSTDIMQGVVYGTRTDEMADDPRLLTRFDFDQAFGTAINRLCSQAVIEQPITLYGKGRQKRGFLPLRDSMQCLLLAVENPPQRGEYRVFNQFEQVYDVASLAAIVQGVARESGLDVQGGVPPRQSPEGNGGPLLLSRSPAPRLIDLGYRPTYDMKQELRIMFRDLVKYRERIEGAASALLPDIRWDGSRAKAERLSL